MEGIPKISVLVITYKQEDVIERTLDAIIAQQEYIYEICVSDDCSTDGTWRILQRYQEQYPSLIKAHRNDPNLGIFENIEQVRTMPTGDVITMVAGDDLPGESWYKNVIDYIKEKRIDYNNELFCIYGDYKCIYPNGDSIVFRQKAIQKRPNEALRLALRGIIGGRGCCYSINVLKRFEKVSQGRSHIVEMAQDRQLQCFSEKNYYIPNLANIYYTGIGVSSHLKEKTLNERQLIIPYALDFFESKGIIVRKKEIDFLTYIRELHEFRFHKRIKSLLASLYYYYRSFDFRYQFLGNDLRYYFFSIIRRFPHKKAISI